MRGWEECCGSRWSQAPVTLANTTMQLTVNAVDRRQLGGEGDDDNDDNNGQSNGEKRMRNNSCRWENRQRPALVQGSKARRRARRSRRLCKPRKSTSVAQVE